MSTENHIQKQSRGKISQHLLQEFAPSDYENWREAAVRLLKGAPFEKRLFTKTYEGITLQPIYMQADIEELSHTSTMPGFSPYVRGNRILGYKTAAWDVVQEIPYSAPAEFNVALQDALERGQTALHLQLDRAARLGLDPDHAPVDTVGKNGISISTVDDLECALQGIALDHVPLFVQAGAATFPFAALLTALAQQRDASFDNTRGSIGMDPLGLLVQEGTLPFSLETAYAMLASLTNWAKQHAPQLKTILIEGSPYHEAGGNAVQELAFTIATAVEYLRQMLHKSLSVDEIAPHMQFTFSIGPNFFMEIAKLRAARLLWAKVVTAFGGSEKIQKMAIHVRTAAWNTTVSDPYINLLRSTVEAFAGVMGGCGSLQVGCFDEAIRKPDESSPRIARNTHLILKEEAHVHEVIDPAGGSWYVETLTDEIARKAWSLFQDVEGQGGMTKALERGFPQEQVAQIASQRLANLSTRKDVLVGTNMYPNLHEQPLEICKTDTNPMYQKRLEDVRNYRQKFSQKPKIPSEIDLDACRQAVLEGATLGDIAVPLFVEEKNAPRIQPIRIQREAEMFEALRASTEAYAVRTGARPRIFLANMGPVALHKARADFSIGFFEVGGFEAISNTGFETVDDAVEAAISSQAPVVVICSIDDTYPEIVPSLAQQLKARDSEIIVILAGYPREHIEAFKKAGVDECIHLRANLYEVLVNIMKKIGV